MSTPRAPEDCETMAQLREGIDAVDSELVALLVRRAAHIDRAVVIKQRENLPARIDARIEDVIQRVRLRASDQGLDPDLAEKLWRLLIEWSIAREESRLGPSSRR